MSRKQQSRKHNAQRRHHQPKRRWMIFGAVLVIGVIVAVVVYFNNLNGKQAAIQPESLSTAASEITVQEAYQKYQEGVFFLDVREQSEWDTFHIPNTTLIPLGELPNRLSELPRDRQIVVVCRSGNRSQAGRDTLLQAGFQDVTSMAGGVTGWSNQGYPIDGVRP